MPTQTKFPHHNVRSTQHDLFDDNKHNGTTFVVSVSLSLCLLTVCLANHNGELLWWWRRGSDTFQLCLFWSGTISSCAMKRRCCCCCCCRCCCCCCCCRCNGFERGWARSQRAILDSTYCQKNPMRSVVLLPTCISLFLPIPHHSFGQGHRLGSADEARLTAPTRNTAMAREEEIPQPVYDPNLTAADRAKQREHQLAAAEARMKATQPNKKKKKPADSNAAPLRGPNSEPLMRWTS